MITISALVTNGRDIWLESRQFYFYSKRQAQTEFNKYLKQEGYKKA